MLLKVKMEIIIRWTTFVLRANRVHVWNREIKGEEIGGFSHEQCTSPTIVCQPIYRHHRRMVRRLHAFQHAAASPGHFASKSWMPRNHLDTLESPSRPSGSPSPLSAIVVEFSVHRQIHYHHSTSSQFISQPPSPSPCAPARPARIRSTRQSCPHDVVFSSVEKSAAGQQPLASRSAWAHCVWLTGPGYQSERVRGKWVRKDFYPFSFFWKYY